jgi:hypothetical protein
MPTFAGQMTTTPPGDPQWRAADGSYIYGYATIKAPFTARPHTGVSTGTYADYERNVGGWAGTRGIGGWMMRLPKNATYYISTADDSGETSLVANVTTTTTASAAPGATVLAVTSATGFAVGLSIAATGLAAGTSIAAINGLNITINPAASGTVASGATVTVTPVGPPTAQKPPAGTT